MRREKQQFVASLRRRFLLRFHMMLILTGAFASGLVMTKILLELRFDVLWLRYVIAVAVAYLVFLAAIKLWLLYVERRMHGRDEDGDLALDLATEVAEVPAEAALDHVDFDFDFFEGAVLLVFAAVLAIVFAAGLYMIWAAPAILAEAAFEALLASALVRRARKIDAGRWVGGVVRRTLAPFAFVLLLSAAIGWAAQQHCPTATKIVHALSCE